MNINYDMNKINSAIHDIYSAVGIRINLLKDDFSPVNYDQQEVSRYCTSIHNCKDGKRLCSFSDTQLLEKCRKSRKTESTICHAGLINIAVPILYDDEIIGYIILGQMKTDTDFSVLTKYIRKLGLDERKMEEYYAELAFFDSDKIQSISNIAAMLVKHILIENMLKPDTGDVIHLAMDFIDKNLATDLSIKRISNSINVSKSVLYKKFHEKFGCTVSDYIKRKRIDKSVKLLEKGNLSIEEVSQAVGFSSASYYSKTFKSYMGESPLRYKKNT